MSNLRKNQIKSLLYQILIAFVTYIFMMGRYIYYAMPYTVGIFLLLFISLGMTLKYSQIPAERAASVCVPMLVNLGLLIVALVGAGGFIGAESGMESLYFVPLHMLNPNITFMPYFINRANLIFKYSVIIITPSFLMYIGMYLGKITREKLKDRVNKFNIKKNN
ncbi:hypothetical protein [Proteocatella sphenisci]|uniref:hypothetical protein n=1 Tax=Proteocatella sphenisci TaxID=181070 RepID=UPI00048E7D3C|nr:hypothetical protein [Proteocatella sphenisci]